jgi:hypothetical protein
MINAYPLQEYTLSNRRNVGDDVLCEVSPGIHKKTNSRVRAKPNTRWYNWATLFLEEINTGTWPSMLEESKKIGTIKYDLESSGTQNREGLRWPGPAATVNYRLVL